MVKPFTSAHHSRETGAALISALLIVSIMSVVTLSILETIRFSARVSTNIADREQSRLYAVAAEELAKSTLQQAWQADAARNPVLDEWTRTPLLFPIPDGTIDGRVHDGANCFNLNSVVKGIDAGAYEYSAEGTRRFEHFLFQFGVPAADATSLAAELADWIDTDQQTSFSGAEDDYYLGLDVPYRTGQQLVADISELKSLRSMTPDLYDTIKPLICVRPTPDAQPLNLNTLEEWQSPILAAYLGEDFDVNSALQIIRERPVGGYDAVDTFFEQAIRDADTIDTATRELFALTSDTYAVAATIQYRETVIGITSTLQISQTGDITTLSRRYGSVQ